MQEIDMGLWVKSGEHFTCSPDFCGGVMSNSLLAAFTVELPNNDIVSVPSDWITPLLEE